MLRLASFVRPRGRHRATPAVDLAPLAEAIETGDVEPNDYAWCPECTARRFHAFHTDGSRTCWTCNTDTEAGQ